MSTSYRVLEFDKKAKEFCVVFTHDGKEHRVFVPASISDSDRVEVERSKAAISRFIESYVSELTRPDITGFEAMIGETYEVTAVDPADQAPGTPGDVEEL